MSYTVAELPLDIAKDIVVILQDVGVTTKGAWHKTYDAWHALRDEKGVRFAIPYVEKKTSKSYMVEISYDEDGDEENQSPWCMYDIAQDHDAANCNREEFLVLMQSFIADVNRRNRAARAETRPPTLKELKQEIDALKALLARHGIK